MNTDKFWSWFRPIDLDFDSISQPQIINNNKSLKKIKKFPVTTGSNR